VFILPKGKALADIDQEETDTREYFGYAGEFDTSPPSRLDVPPEILPPEQQQQLHVRVAGAKDPKDNVISILVFSSQTGQWENREFMPGRCAPRHLYDMVTAPHPSCVKIWKTAEYWQRSLYVHCWNNIVMILRNSERVYDMALLPGKAYGDNKFEEMSELPKRTILVNYEKGVHYVTLDKLQLHVWKLTESIDAKVGWMLAHKADLSPSNKKVWIGHRVPWEMVKNNNALVSLFEPCKNKKIIYAKEASSRNTTGNVDGEVEDDGKAIHEVDGFNETTNDVDDAGHNEGEPHKS
jgi:hypothetical protein